MRSPTFRSSVLLAAAVVLVLAGCSQGTGQAEPTSQSGSAAGSEPSPTLIAAEQSDADDRDVPFDAAADSPRIVSAEWGHSLADAEGFSSEPGRFGARGSYRDEASQCVTEFIEVLPELSADDDPRKASDDGVRWLSDQLEPGSGEGLDAYIGDSFVDRDGGGEVAIRLAVAAWEDGSNAILGARAFPAIDVAVLFLLTCPATANSRDEIQTLAAAHHLSLVVGERQD
ncbi:hypothetical protein [Microbacterium sp. SS28]|uniref:hypothetical protein n=1 Tax=Microbacterium sp. SS28 TaxID=2919948 RepID=UPI001FAABA77|nr:hypothetical protein [Microbacterium sp. SS28]